MKLTELYSEYLANWLSEGSLLSRDKISLLGVKPLYDRFITNSWITKVWMITQIPVHYDVNLSQAIRYEMSKLFPGVRTVVHMYNRPVTVPVAGETFLRQLRRAAGSYEKYEQVFDSLSEDQKLTGASFRANGGGRFRIDRESLYRVRDQYDSYKYAYEQVSSGGSFTETYYFIQVSAKTRRELHRYKQSLNNLLSENVEGRHSRQSRVLLREVHGNIGTYLDNFCPAAFINTDSVKFQSMLLSQENKASLLPSKTKGLVNSNGIILGLDWQTKQPFFLSFFESGAAQVVMIDGKSGCGKTFLAFCIALELIGFGVHCSAIDIKGSEWDKLQPYASGLLCIAMSGKNAKFVNTLRIDSISCDKSNCAELFDNAVQGTVDIFCIIVQLQEREGNLADLITILETAVTKLYASHDVFRENPDTFCRTESLKYSDVVDIVSSLASAQSFSEDQKRICGLICTRSSPYFMSEGRYADAMKNELTVSDIINSPMVIYNMNKNNAETLSTLDTLKIYMSQFLDGEKHFLRKQQKKHTAVFYEELQRCGSLHTLVRSISARVTGSRSNNLTVFLLLNAVSAFDDSAFAAIRSNITTKIIGLVEKGDQDKLASDYGCEDIEHYIEIIRENRNGYYQNCFAVSFDNGLQQDKVLLKSVVPNGMAETFRTRDRMEI